MHLLKLKKENNQWRNFLKQNEHLIIHTPEWKSFIEQTFSRTRATYYAIANQKGEIRFMLPVFHTKLSLVPNVSSAFLEYGGPAGKISSKEFQKIKLKLPKNIEVRQGLNTNLLRKNFAEIKHFKRFVLALKTEEETWMHIHKFKRKAVRLAEKSGIIVKDVSEKELDDLYALYLKAMKQFGTPPYAKKYFKNFYKFFVSRNLAKVLGAYYKGKLVAFLTGFIVCKRIHININVSDNKYLKFRPNDALHWEFIKWGCNNKFKEFDFGRVREESGQFAFKKKWKAELLDLSHFYFSKPKHVSDVSDLKFQMFTKLWSRVPTSISRKIGPWLRESFGI